jgi:hypothetical protein
MNLGLYEYNVLPDVKKTQLLWDNGVFLMNREDDNQLVNLYALFDFYVEVYYMQKSNEIKRIKTFKSINPLQPYLDRINL